MDLSFGACKLQVQVPEKGQYIKPSDLIGKNVGTSFVHLTEDYFTALEREQDAANGLERRKLRTKIIELSGSVEAACALGVADGIVDLVGECHSRQERAKLTPCRIRRDDESRWTESNRYRGIKYSRPDQVQVPNESGDGRPDRLTNTRSHQYVPCPPCSPPANLP
jgi:hypothetical protein